MRVRLPPSHTKAFGLSALGIAIASGGLLGLIGSLSPRGLLIAAGFAFVILSAILIWLPRRFAWGVSLLVLASTLNGITVPFSLASAAVDIRPDQVVLLALLVSLALGLLTRQIVISYTALDIPIAAFLLSNLVASILHSPTKAASYQSVVLLTVYGLMYFVSVNLLMQNPNLTAGVIKLAVGTGIVHAVLGCLFVLMYSVGIDNFGVTVFYGGGSVGARSTFVEPNLLGIYLAAIGSLVVAYVYTKALPKVWYWLLGVGLFFLPTTLFLTLTRSAWVAFIGSILTIAFISRKKTDREVAGCVVLLAFLLILLATGWLLVNPLVSALSGTTNLLGGRILDMTRLSGSSIVGRLQAYSVAFDRWAENPIWGRGTLSGAEVGHAWFYSSVVQTLHDTGLVGLASLTLMYGTIVRQAWKEYRVASHPFYKAGLLGLLCGNIVLIASSQTSSFLWTGFPWVFMGLTIASVHASRLYRRGRRRTVVSGAAAQTASPESHGDDSYAGSIDRHGNT